MFSTKVQDAMNAQINAELYSAYIYLAMSAHFETANLLGFAKWMRIQYQEETEHALKFFDFIHDRDGTVALKAVDAPPPAPATPLAVFEKTLAHEQKVTAMIHSLYKLAVDEGDYAAQVFLQWFVNEQVEEEKNATEAVAKLRMIGDFAPGLLMMDEEMGERAG
jgi:ferritin